MRPRNWIASHAAKTGERRLRLRDRRAMVDRPPAYSITRSMRALNVGGNSSDAAPHQSSARQVTTYSNAAIASTTPSRIGPASATSGRSCALTAPTHCPMVTNLEISPRTSPRNLCVRNFVESHDPSKICTATERTEVPRLTCDYPRTRTGIATAHRSMTMKTVTSIVTHERNFRGGIT